MLMAGEKSDNGRGAELVVEEFHNIATLVKIWKNDQKRGKDGNGGYKFSEEVLKGLKGRVWLPEGKLVAN